MSPPDVSRDSPISRQRRRPQRFRTCSKEMSVQEVSNSSELASGGPTNGATGNRETHNLHLLLKGGFSNADVSFIEGQLLLVFRLPPLEMSC